jgi:hypothetical protein
MDRVLLQPSPSVANLYRVIFHNNKRVIDFGDVKVPYYPHHQNPKIMRAQLLRKGAVIPEKLRKETDLVEIHREMLKIRNSSSEDWNDIYSPEFWERWVLLSHTSVTKSKLSMTMSHGILFVPSAQGLWVE